MDAQQIQRLTDYFLGCVDYDKIYTLPYKNDACVLAAHSRDGRIVRVLTGEYLIKMNVKDEASRLKMRLDPCVIDSAANTIWRSQNFTDLQSQFTNLANDANEIIQNNIR